MKAALRGLIITVCAAGQTASAASLPDTMLTSMWNFSLARLQAAMVQMGNNTTAFPRRAPQTSGVWETEGASSWISGFYPGCLWYAYEKSGDTMFRYNARRWTEALYAQRLNTGTHDVGFMIFCSYGNAYRLLGTSSYRTVILEAASSLSTRYRAAGIIDSWNWSPYDTGWEAIIDNMMNLELLFWASQNGGSSTYNTYATSHAEKSLANHFRADSSTFHVVKYRRTSPYAVLSQETRQGYADWSCWARGQAWAIYGFTMAYRFTGDPRFLVRAGGAADYFLRRLPADRIPYWDFDAPGATGVPDTAPRDASSSAIVASALLELSTLTGVPDSVRYRDSALSLIRGLWTTRYRGLTTQASILNHSTGSRKEGHDVDMGIIYADYYFLEALIRYARISGTTAVANPCFRCRGPVSSSALELFSPVFTETFNLLGRKGTPFSGKSSPAVIILRSSGADGAEHVHRKAVSGRGNSR
jgi:unsaturated chondroitin disaccharide hydrolase